MHGPPSSPGMPDFEEAARKEQRGLIGEYWDFVRHNKAWWLVPILVVLGLFGILIALSGTAAAPFIYTLF